MQIFSRLFKTILLTVGIYLIAINVIRWSSTTHVSNIWLSENTFVSFSNWSANYQMNRYFGSEWFYNVISTFPGASTTIAMFNQFGNIISMFPTTFDPQNIDVLGGILALLSILFTPALLLITIVIDILNNALWFLSFLSI